MWKINHLWAILKTDGREWKILLECLIWGTPFKINPILVPLTSPRTDITNKQSTCHQKAIDTAIVWEIEMEYNTILFARMVFVQKQGVPNHYTKKWRTLRKTRPNKNTISFAKRKHMEKNLKSQKSAIFYDTLELLILFSPICSWFLPTSLLEIHHIPR